MTVEDYEKCNQTIFLARIEYGSIKRAVDSGDFDFEKVRRDSLNLQARLNSLGIFLKRYEQ